MKESFRFFLQSELYFADVRDLMNDAGAVGKEDPVIDIRIGMQLDESYNRWHTWPGVYPFFAYWPFQGRQARYRTEMDVQVNGLSSPFGLCALPVTPVPSFSMASFASPGLSPLLQRPILKSLMNAVVVSCRPSGCTIQRLKRSRPGNRAGDEREKPPDLTRYTFQWEASFLNRS